MIREDIKLFNETMNQDDEMISQRLYLLANSLNEVGYGNGQRE